MDDALLIEQLRKFPFLYDKKHVDFKNKQKRRNAWETIAIICEDSVENVEKRWAILRNRYALEKRKMRCVPSGSAAIDVPSWRYFGMMAFLDSYIKARKTSGNYEKDHAKQNVSVAWDSIAAVMEEEDGDPQSETPEAVEVVTTEEKENLQPRASTSSDKAPRASTSSDNAPRASTSSDNASRASTSSNNATMTPKNSSLGNIKKRKTTTSATLAEVMDQSFQRVERLLQNSSSEDEDDAFGKAIGKTLKRKKNKAQKAQIKAKIWQVIAEYESD